jgi:hypothetical protein
MTDPIKLTEESDADELTTTEPAAAADTATEKADIVGEAATGGVKTTETDAPKTKAKSSWKSFWRKYWRKKFLTIPLTIVLLVAVFLALPPTRYQLLGLFLKENLEVAVVDKSSNKPVTNAKVQLGAVSAQTDAKGRAKLHVKVGSQQLTVIKKYYATTTVNVLVPLHQKQAPYAVSVKATGRQVPVMAINTITGKPLADALLTAADSTARTDMKGEAVIVVPADKPTVAIKISRDTYNTASTTLHVTEQSDPVNTFKLTPAGKVYFLSKLSGKIDVVKTDLDGLNRQTVLAGTGSEISTDTILLASRDWKYLALKSQRDGGQNPKLFLIDTSNDKVTTMDEGNANFSAVGWADHRFAYLVYRNGLQRWQPKAQALKTFDAESGKLTTIDESDAEGTGDSDYTANQFGSVYIMDNELVYTKNWSASYYSASRLNGKQISLTSVKPDGSAKKDVKDFPVPDNYNYYSVQTRLYEPQGLYIQVPGQNGDKSTYYEYEAGKVTPKTDVTDQTFNDPYPTYLVSPSGKQTFWSDARDGKNTLFVGDIDAKNGQQIASLSEFTPYGWYSDDYLFVSQKGSELYIMPVAGGAPIKVSDYHKPDYNFQGYGYGYGGL